MAFTIPFTRMLLRGSMSGSSFQQQIRSQEKRFSEVEHRCEEITPIAVQKTKILKRRKRGKGGHGEKVLKTDSITILEEKNMGQMQYLKRNWLRVFWN